jgi:transposase
MREIGAMGYAGGVSQLKAYLHAFKVVHADPVVRFETAPGQQVQADFTTIRRGRDRLLAYVATLGFNQAQLSALPIRAMQSVPAIARASIVPFESLQHPLSVYRALLEGCA